MKEIIKKIGTGLAAVSLLAFSAVGILGASAYAVDTPREAVCTGINKVINVADCQSSTETTITDNVWLIAAQIVTWIMWAVGIICVVFIIFGGIRYATSGGDAEKVKAAKNTLLYAIIGLAIALLAAVIVNVVSGFSDGLLKVNG